ncbi:carboxymuconolactone decarboxylase family protein [Luteipulveratus mongoliensis]|uniref:carboxymuconolactone decarboxylase family protein n=1 Tax=Luteipulveratus mongoliensis TaxID=571913 RepID=UPI0009F85CDF|nr:carboxymuconolactone decarboxylase family protein [Luteipulveratus mongoliensis]
MSNGGDPISELHRRGVQHFSELVEGGEDRLSAMFRTVPALGEVAVGVVYGHLHHRPALDPRTREVATLAAIVAAGMTGPPLSVHTRTGLASGLAPAEITETVVQTAAFAGFPRAVTHRRRPRRARWSSRCSRTNPTPRSLHWSKRPRRQS